ncbi:MAG TPA: hypothetical protein VD768_06220 [Sphingomicrobium sp.]|nr:hypothetical protein [Sphingomicrobium sp.]
MSNPQTHVGTVTGTGAAINVPIGFQPDYVLIYNAVTGAKIEWFRGMAAASAIKTVVAGDITVAATNGVSALDSKTAGEGFVIGADAQVNVTGNAIRFFATRSGPGAN